MRLPRASVYGNDAIVRAGAVQEILARLAADRDAIVAAIPRARHAEKVRRVVMALGDPHNGGRTTSRVDFANGASIYYKARDCRAEAAFHDFAALLWRCRADAGRPGAAAAGRKLPVRPAFVLRGSYAWVEGIVKRAPRSAPSTASASRRAGELLALLDMLQAIDCNAWNVIASGGTVVPIDTETILQPLLAWHRGTAPDPEDPVTVLRVGLLPGVDGAGRPTFGAGRWLRDDDLCAGFKTMYLNLLEHRKKIRASREWRALARAPVRALVRATADYAAMAREQGARRGDLAPRAIHAAELRALERGDVPRFVTVAPDSHQLAEGDEIVDDCIIEQGWARAARWLDNASTNDCAERLAVIRAALTFGRLRRRGSKNTRTQRSAGGGG